MIKLEWSNKRIKVSELIPYERNPRKITDSEIKKLKKSLEEYNLVDIPVIDFDNILVSGHQRARALFLLGRGEEEIDVRVPNRKLTEKEFKNLNLELNKLRGIFDFEMLGADFEVDELKDIGFTEIELGLKTFEDYNKDDFGLKDEKQFVCPKCGYSNEKQKEQEGF